MLHELFNVTDELKMIPRHAEIDAVTINAVLEEGGKFAAEVLFPLNISGDTEGCKLDKTAHVVTAPAGYKAAYEKVTSRAAGPSLSCDPRISAARACPIVLNQCLYEMMNSANQAWTNVPRPVARRLRGAARARHA